MLSYLLGNLPRAFLRSVRTERTSGLLSMVEARGQEEWNILELCMSSPKSNYLLQESLLLWQSGFISLGIKSALHFYLFIDYVLTVPYFYKSTINFPGENIRVFHESSW